MGFLDDVINKATTALGGVDTAAHPMLGQAMDLLKNNPYGGLAGLVQAFRDKGLGEVVSSWISTGPNLPISGAQIQQVLGEEHVQQLAGKMGIPMDKVQEGLATLLPQMIDKATPTGQLPTSH